MAINVTLGEAKPQEEKPFPKLMRQNTDKYNLVVLFTAAGCGTVILDTDKEDPYAVGHHSLDWAEKHFIDYNEPVTIQNA